MSRRTNTWNGFETSLASQLLAGEFSFTVDSALGLIDPLYAAIDPDVPGNREWIKIVSVVGNTITVENPNGRGLAGSVGPVGVGTDHAVGAKMRMVFSKQLQDDIFSDIEDLETVTANLPGTYLALDGSNDMAGPLTLQAGAPTLVDEATRKDYVDTEDTNTEAAAKLYSDSLDHDHATPIGVHNTTAESHGAKENTNPHNHDRYLNSEAVAAVGTPWVGQYLDLHGVADAALKWNTGRVITVVLSGDLSGSGGVSVDGTANKTITISAAVLNDSHFHDGRYLKLSGGTLTGTLITQSIDPAVSNARSLGSSSKRWQTLWLSNEGIHFGNNDTIEYDDSNNEWKFKPDNVLRTILGANVSRFSGAMTLYDPMATFSSGGYATLVRRDSDGRILERVSHPKYKSNARTPEAFTLRAKELVRRAKGYVYGDIESPDEGETVGLFSTEVASVFPEMTHMVDGEPKGVHYDMLVTPILEVLRDYELRLHDLETAH